MILALIFFGIPCLILGLFLFECYQHHRELEKAERDLNGPPPQRRP